MRLNIDCDQEPQRYRSVLKLFILEAVDDAKAWGLFDCAVDRALTVHQQRLAEDAKDASRG